MRRNAWLYLLLGVLVAAVYGQTLGHDFLALDDDIYVTENPLVREGFNLAGLWRAWSGGYEWNWHPLTWMSHTLDAELWGVRPFGHHLTNVALHLVNVWLLFALLERATGRRVGAAVAAALFAVHPLHVEVVCWISARKDLLSTAAGLVTLHAYVRYAAAPTAKRYALVALALVVGLLCKEMLVTLPAVMLLFDLWPLERVPLASWLRPPHPATASRPEAPGSAAVVGWRRALLEKVPLGAIVAVSATIIFVVQRNIGAMKVTGAVDLPHRVANAIVSYARYLETALWPHDLGVLYVHPDLAGGTPLTGHQVAAAAFVLVALGVLAVHSRRGYAIVGLAWWLGTLVPVLGLVQIGGQARADRYAYLSHIGLYIVVAFALDELVRYRRPAATAPSSPRPPSPSGRRGWALCAAAAVVVTTLAAVAHAQARTWRDSGTLFRQALRVDPRNVTVHFALGLWLDEHGDPAGAESHFREAVRIKPDHVDAQSRLAILLAERRQLRAAIRHFRLAAELAPNDAEMRFNLGLGLVQLGDDAQAIEELERALELAPAHGRARAELRRALAREARRRFATDPGASRRLAERAARLQATSAP